MDQPTYLDLRITGTEQNVMQAAIAAIRGIKKNHDPKYVEKLLYQLLGYDSRTSKKSRKERVFFFGACGLRPSTDSDPAEFLYEDMCYWAFDEFDVDEIADAIIQDCPDVEFHLNAEITVTCYEGYHTIVDIHYVSGEKTMDVRYDEFDAEYKAQIKMIVDAVGEANAKKLADEMLHDLFDGEWTQRYADIHKAFLDAGYYKDDVDGFISQMREKANELFGVVIDDDKDEDKE